MGFRLGTLAAGLLLLVMAAPAFAQNDIMHVNVPFAFSVDKKVLPAGEYVVTSNDLMTYTLLGKQSSFVMTNNIGSKGVQHPPSLVFVQRGSQYRLSQIWMYDSETGHSVALPSFNGKNMLASARTVEVLAQR
jgi:hypothetical protein